MKLAILSHGLRAAGGRSVGYNFLSELRYVAPANQYLIVIPEGCGYSEIRYPNKTELIAFSSRRRLQGRLMYDLYELPRLVDNFSPDVILGLGNVGLLHPKVPQAILFHKPQLIYPSKHKEGEVFTKRVYNWGLKFWIKWSLRSTQLVLCQTEASKKRFQSTFNFHKRIVICPNAISKVVETPPCAGVIKHPEKAKGRFILFTLTRYYGHKNLEIIPRVFEKYYDKLKDVVCILTIAENQHPSVRRLLANIRKLRLAENIMNVGPIPQAELRRYYSNSDALFLPTFLESFTATYLEAMHFSVPILTSDLDFAHAICGDAAWYFNPWSEQSICDAILKLKNDPVLKSVLIDKGAERLKAIRKTWREIVQETFEELYRLCNL